MNSVDVLLIVNVLISDYLIGNMIVIVISVSVLIKVVDLLYLLISICSLLSSLNTDGIIIAEFN